MWARTKGCKAASDQSKGDANININPLIILFSILAVAVLSGAVTFFMLLSIAWTHKPISAGEFFKLCVAEIKTKRLQVLNRDKARQQKGKGKTL